MLLRRESALKQRLRAVEARAAHPASQPSFKRLTRHEGICFFKMRINARSRIHSSHSRRLRFGHRAPQEAERVLQEGRAEIVLRAQHATDEAEAEAANLLLRARAVRARCSRIAKSCLI